MLLSPEQLVALNQSDPKPNVNLFQCDVYAMGLTLLSCMSLMHGSHFYYFDGLNRSGLEQAFEKVSDSYSETLTRFVARMLYKNAHERPTFQKYCSILKPYELLIEHLQPFEIDLEKSKQMLARDEDQLKIRQSQSMLFQSHHQSQILPGSDRSQVQP